MFVVFDHANAMPTWSRKSYRSKLNMLQHSQRFRSISHGISKPRRVGVQCLRNTVHISIYVCLMSQLTSIFNVALDRMFNVTVDEQISNRPFRRSFNVPKVCDADLWRNSTCLEGSAETGSNRVENFGEKWQNSIDKALLSSRESGIWASSATTTNV